MFFVYAIKSLSRNYIYVGLTKDINTRIERHNRGFEKTTKPYRPFVLIYLEKYETRILAREREKYLKSGIGKEFLKNILLNASDGGGYSYFSELVNLPTGR